MAGVTLLATKDPHLIPGYCYQSHTNYIYVKLYTVKKCACTFF